ncbi:hypothetical protein GVN20_03745 [Runella sp. CRIBMP]|uniref:hypothetical protein n=1 Tax=Runella sp. CRIBMP TaxID=2683261 RepID=UPI00141256E7|nr:hypothetical protein [Runella sp. CRIBMP]NBB18460.1 hypothetical protein [Runella sp. CRIBMP]
MERTIGSPTPDTTSKNQKLQSYFIPYKVLYFIDLFFLVLFASCQEKKATYTRGKPLHEGTLIGTLSIAPKPMGLPLIYTTPIKTQMGKYDVYFFCKNDKAATGRDLMMLSQVGFER